MRTHLSIDPEVLQLVRHADPLLDPGVTPETEMDADTALRTLAPRLSGSRTGRPRHIGYFARVGVAACGAAGAAFVLTNLVSTGGGPGILRESGAGVGSARAATIVKAARAALLYPAGSILEEEEVTHEVRPDGSRITTDVHHSWVSATPPYESSRLIAHIRGIPAFEQEITNGRLDLYDPRDNTIYEQAPPTYDLRPGASPGSYVLTVPKATLQNFCLRPVPPADRGMVTLTLSAAQADALRSGADEVEYVGHQGNVQTNPLVVPVSPVVPDDPNTNSALAQVRFMLGTRGVLVDPNATLNGARAIRISSPRLGLTYWVSPGDYRPLQVVANVNGSVSTSEYPIYRVLTGAAASSSIFSLTAQHPSARVITSGDEYAREKCRLRFGTV